jgi:hypothetical protein
MFKHVVIWGLTKKRDSYRFIHQGFFDNLVRMGYQVNWVEDLWINREKVTPTSLVFGVDVASKYLPFVPGATYVTLNISPETELGSALKGSENWLRIQEYTVNAKGVQDPKGSITKYNDENRTLYMPWGTPVACSDFCPPINPEIESKIEYWVGAIWNDELGQGNSKVIEEYRSSLSARGIRFKRVGGSRFFAAGVSEAKNIELVRKSALGTSVVGAWQERNQYYPCRLFKSVSAGVAPSSNLDARQVFENSLLYSDSIEELVELGLSEPKSRRTKRVIEAQKILNKYTYESSLGRIFRALRSEW